MKLSDILKNEKGTKSIGNSGYYGLYNTFERLKNSEIKENQLERYANYMLKHIDGYTPRDLIYFVGTKIEEASSNEEKKLLSIYNKAAWNNIADKYRMDKFFESGKTGYLSKIKDYLLDKYEKLSNGLYTVIDKYASKLKGNDEYSERSDGLKMVYSGRN
ncbi:MAG: hypothetical protein ACP5MV_03845 [Candidatus Parvarchaeum sp.]